jgi:hypothetical protein
MLVDCDSDSVISCFLRALMKSQSLVASFCETLLVEYKPVFERLSEFMLAEMPMPGGSPK